MSHCSFASLCALTMLSQYRYTGDDGCLEDDELERNLANGQKYLCELGISDGSTIDVTEASEAFQVDGEDRGCVLCVAQLDRCDWDDEAFPEFFAIVKEGDTVENFKKELFTDCDSGRRVRRKMA